MNKKTCACGKCKVKELEEDELLKNVEIASKRVLLEDKDKRSVV